MYALNRAFNHFFTALLCLLALLAQGASAANHEPVEADHIVAVVGGDVITYYELNNRLQAALRQLQKQGTPLPPQDQLERQMLERMIMDKVQLLQARDSGMLVDDVQLDQAIGRIAAGNKMTPQQFRQAIELDGIQFKKFREEIRDEMTIGRLRDREVDSRLVISDGEIDNYLANQPQGTGAEEFRLAHILLRAPESATPEQIQKLRVRAEQALNRAQAGENFAQLTAAFSDAPDALQGGDIGFRPLDRLPALYSDAAKRLKDGEISPLLRSSAGFHIVKLLGKRGGHNEFSAVQQTHARHILIRINEVVSEAEARRKLENLRERLVNGKDFAEQARLYSQDGSASKGGDLGWLNPGDTVPEFERAMDILKDNELSPVVQSPFGMHLIQVIERRLRDMSAERQRNMARQALRERKLDEAYQDWLRQLRDRSYVENRLEEK
jgi:peptidyl-prolyl cis-trans isomerase SurA